MKYNLIHNQSATCHHQLYTTLLLCYSNRRNNKSANINGSFDCLWFIKTTGSLFKHKSRIPILNHHCNTWEYPHKKKLLNLFKPLINCDIRKSRWKTYEMWKGNKCLMIEIFTFFLPVIFAHEICVLIFHIYQIESIKGIYGSYLEYKWLQLGFPLENWFKCSKQRETRTKCTTVYKTGNREDEFGSFNSSWFVIFPIHTLFRRVCLYEYMLQFCEQIVRNKPINITFTFMPKHVNRIFPK